MDLLTILLLLIALCLAVMGVFAWLLHRMGEPILPAWLAPRPRRPSPAARPASRPTPAPQRPAQPPLDRSDPTVGRYEQVLTLAERTLAAVQALPKTIQERVTMGVELQAIGHHLDTMRAQLATAAPEARAAQAPQLERLEGRLSSMQQDATTIAASLEQLAALEQRLTAESLALGDELAALERSSPFPRAALPIAAAGADLVGRVDRLAPRSELGSFNALKYRLHESQELLAAVARCRAELARFLDPEAMLRALMAEQAPPAQGTAATPPSARGEEAKVAPPARGTAAAPPPSAPDEEAEIAALEYRLLRMAMGDKGTVERLIVRERQRDPDAPRLVLLRRVIEQWEHDRR